MLLDLIVGARPNFVKMAAIIHALKHRQAAGAALDFRLIHTGQHYDWFMSRSFFEQLAIPEPDVNFEVGSGTQAEQTGAIMVAYERLLSKAPSDWCVVVGDVTSTMACALAARKCGVPVAHVEAGIRSGDLSMPEEVNRIVTDAVSELFFTTSASASAALCASGVPAAQVHCVGNTMIDTLCANLEKARQPDCWVQAGLEPGGYYLMTVHRKSNTDDMAQTMALIHQIGARLADRTIIFPCHPRILDVVRSQRDLPPNIIITAPQSYLEFIHLLRHARGVITDSGGVSEEATVLGIPCLTLRDTTERPETVDLGTNEIAGQDAAQILSLVDRMERGDWKAGQVPPLWDGQSGQRIVAVFETLAASTAH